MLFLVASSSFSQQTTSQSSFTQHKFLEKSKKQNKIGTILLVVGGGLIATSIIIPKGDLVYDGICIGAYCSDKYKNDGIRSVFFIAGGIAALSSVPLFIVSRKNRRKSMFVSFKMENTVQLYNQNLVHISFPVLKVNANF
jgi:hypothetical protein